MRDERGLRRYAHLEVDEETQSHGSWCSGPAGRSRCRCRGGRHDVYFRRRARRLRSDAGPDNDGTKGPVKTLAVRTGRQGSANRTGEPLQHLWRRLCQRPRHRHLRQGWRLCALGRWRQYRPLTSSQNNSQCVAKPRLPLTAEIGCKFPATSLSRPYELDADLTTGTPSCLARPTNFAVWCQPEHQCIRDKTLIASNNYPGSAIGNICNNAWRRNSAVKQIERGVEFTGSAFQPASFDCHSWLLSSSHYRHEY